MTNTPAPTHPGDNPLLTYQEAAKVLQVTDRTVWQLVKDGVLPAVRFGRIVRIDPEDLKTFIRKAKDGQGVRHAS